jgi:hypothetical protein
MKEISNQALAILLIVAIVATVSETVFLVSRIEIPTETTGAATGLTKVNITSAVVISLPVSTVDFGTLFQGDSKNTTTDSPTGLTVQNDGSINVNVSLARDASSGPLFGGSGGGDNTNTFQFAVANSTELGSFDWAESTTAWTNVPGTIPVKAIAVLKYQDATDLARVNLLIRVPSDEPAGSKNETLVFTAQQA